MKQLLSITLAFTLVRLISQPGAAQQAQPSPTPGGRGGRGGRGGGTPPPIQAKPEELAKKNIVDVFLVAFTRALLTPV